MVATKSPPMTYSAGELAALQTRATDILAKAPEVRLIGCHYLPEGPVAIPEIDAVLVPLEMDPQFRAGALGIPRSQRRTLVKLQRRQVAFDCYFLLHELEDDARAKLSATPTAKLTTLIPPAPVDRVAEHLAADMSAMSDAAAGAASRAVLGIAAVALSPLLLPLALFSAVGVDPVLIGALTPVGTRRPGDEAAFFEIVRWNSR